jgi:multiple sugar transport system ATP-binding protein
VIVSEYIGAHSVLMCDCGGQKVVVELKSETPIPLGETLRFRVNPAGVHLFDAESDLAI